MPRITLLHGFLGSPADWADVLAELAPGYACDCVPLAELGCASIKEASDGLARRLRAEPSALIVGYSLGGRIALELAATQGDLVPRLLLLSASPGIVDPSERAARAAEDDARAAELLRDGVDAFAERWYRLPLFAPFMQHPSFASARARRALGDAAFWARCVAGCSPGRAVPRWDAVPRLAGCMHFAAGALDERYAFAARRVRALSPQHDSVEIVEGAGHVLPLEAPGPCARMIEQLCPIE